MAKVTIDLPGTPKGEDVEVGGLGLFKNGSTTEVPKERVEDWEAFSNRKWPSSGDLSLPVLEDSKAPSEVEKPPEPAATTTSKTKEVK